MENNNGKGIFYGVIGVATLIVAIIGATFAYFTATSRSGEYLTGTAATAGLAVHVTRLTGFSTGEGATEATNASFVMVPQLDQTLNYAITGTAGKGVAGLGTDSQGKCIDANGSLVCSIYKITVQNVGSAAIDVSGKIQFYAGATTLEPNGESTPAENGSTPNVDAYTDKDSVINHLKWARLVSPITDIGEKLNSAVIADMTMPTTLETYATEVYQANPDGTQYKYAATNANQFLFARNVTATSNKDILGTAMTVVNGAHGAYTDLIDPTDDLVANTWTKNNDHTPGLYRLAAKGQAGDTMAYYVVVWISENKQSQNEDDKGTFVGQVTFNSADGSGATSTFTENYSA